MFNESYSVQLPFFNLFKSLELMNFRIYLKDLEGKFVYVNPACAADFGQADPIDAVGKSDFDFFDEEYAAECKRQELQLIETKQPILDQEELEVLHGTEKWLNTSKFPTFDDDGNVVAILGISIDITEKKRELARYQLAVEGAPDGLWHIYPETDDVWFSARWKDMLGYGVDELKNERREFFDRIHPDDFDRVHTAIEDHLTGKTPVYECEFRMLHKDQTYRWIQAHGKGTREAGKATAFAGSHRDITEAKFQKRRQLEKEEFYLHVLDTIPGFVFVKNAEGRFTFVNQAIASAFGRPKKEILGKRDAELIDDDEEQAERCKEVLQFEEDDEQILTGTTTLLNREEWFKKRRLAATKVPIWLRDDTEEPKIHVLGVATDVTDLHVTQDELRKERDLLHNLMEHVPDAVFIKNTNHEFLRVNAELARIVGKDKRDLIGKTDLDVFDRDHAEAAIMHEKNVIEMKKPILNSIGIAKTVEGLRWRQVSKVPVMDEEGNVIYIVGISRDIDQLKRLNDELSKQKELFEQIMENVPLFIFVKDRNYRFKTCSRSFALRHGYRERSDVVGKTDYDHWPPAVANRSRKGDEDVMSKDDAAFNNSELEPFGDGKEVRTIEISKIPLHNALGDVEGLLGVYEDVTERVEKDKAEFQKHVNQSLAHYLKSRVTLLKQNTRGLQLRLGKSPELQRLSKAIKFLEDATVKAANLTKLDQAEKKWEKIDVFKTLADIVEITDDSRVRLSGVPDQPVYIVGSRFHFENAISELLTNAMYFAPADDEGGLIEIYGEIGKTDCCIHFKDNGPGVPEHLRAGALFELFKSYPENRSGMGLNYVKRVAEFHGGDVDEFGQEGQGAHFVVRFPIAQEGVEV